MLEQIVTSDSVADDEKQHNDAEQSTSRTPINLSPQRNGLVHTIDFSFSLQHFFRSIHFTHIWSIVLNNWYEKYHQNVICSQCFCSLDDDDKQAEFFRFNLTITARVILQFVNKRLASCGLFFVFSTFACHSGPCSSNYKNNCEQFTEENLIWTQRMMMETHSPFLAVEYDKLYTEQSSLSKRFQFFSLFWPCPV